MSDLVLDALAAYRLTRLVTADTITAPLRDGLLAAAYAAEGADLPSFRASATDVGWTEVARSDPSAPALAELVTCRWCTGVWVGLGVVAARRLVPRLWAPLGRALAFGAVAALLAGLEDE